MKIVEETERSKEYQSPERTLLRKFPMEAVCRTCKAVITLETVEDIYFWIDDEHYHRDLSWSCPICMSSNQFTDDVVLVNGFRSLFPAQVWWKENGHVVAFLLLWAVILAGVLLSSWLSS